MTMLALVDVAASGPSPHEIARGLQGSTDISHYDRAIYDDISV